MLINFITGGIVIGQRRLLTRNMCARAIEMIRPVAELILKGEDMTWGPNYGYGEISGPGIKALPFHFGDIGQKWDEIKWGAEINFYTIAQSKRKLAARESLKTTAIVRTSEIVNTRPQILERDEFLYAGGVACGEISIGFSGALGRVDEGIAEMVLIALLMLLHVKAEGKLKAGESQI